MTRCFLPRLSLALALVTIAGAVVAAQPRAAADSQALDALSASLERVVERVSPAVVEIFTSGYAFGPGGRNVVSKQAGGASGIIIDPAGYIVTNAHVVQRARRIQVLLRGAQRVELRVPVIERQDAPGRFMEMVDPARNLVAQLDLLGVDVTEALAAVVGPLRGGDGVLVAGMSADAAPPADRFQPGDVVHAVNGAVVHSLAELKAAVAGLTDGDPACVQLERAGLLEFATFEVD